jgi:chromatin segregation and condensation protein Rec8/ScpA/Scc1 (kleisin family)
MKLSFREFAGKGEKTEVIVGFLALLELVKQGILSASQTSKFGDILLESDAVSTPTYE